MPNSYTAKSVAVMRDIGGLRAKSGGGYFVPERQLYELLDEATVAAVYKETVKLHDQNDPWLDKLKELDPAIIFAEYQKIFALLIQIGYPGKIIKFCNSHHSEPNQRFNDHKLPFSKEQLSQVDKALVDSLFLHDQYLFLAPVLDGKTNPVTYTGKHVLPFLFSELLPGGNGGFANVYQTEIHPDHDRLNPPWQGPKPHVYARKELLVPEDDDKEQQEGEFMLEVNALTILQKRAHKNILPLLASYKVGERYNMIFPLADCNLAHYLANVGPPAVGIDTVKFLNEIVMLAVGLMNIHTTRFGLTLVSPNLLTSRHFGSHRDIKPSNILCHDSTFMIADFGLSRFHDKEKTPRPDAEFPFGSSTYRAPECGSFEHGRAGDIWSLGCVYAEVVAYLVFGKREGPQRLRRARLIGSTSTESGTSANLQRDLFHNDSVVKPAVLDFLNGMVTESPANRELIKDMVEAIIWMLEIKKEKRPKIDAVVERFGNIVLAEARRHDAESCVSAEIVEYLAGDISKISEGRPNASKAKSIYTWNVLQGLFGSRWPGPSKLGSGSSRTVRETLTDSLETAQATGLPHLEPGRKLYAWAKVPTAEIPELLQPEGTEQALGSIAPDRTTSRDIHTPQSLTTNHIPSTIEDQRYTPHSLEESPCDPHNSEYAISSMKKHLAALDSVDTMFVIDDSLNMRGCWEEVQQSLSIFAAVATEHDQDGIEVALMYSGPPKPFSGITDEEGAMEVFNNIRHTEPKGGIAERLEGIICDYVKKYEEGGRETTKPLNIIVLTNGVVGPWDSFDEKLLHWAGVLDNLHAPSSQLGIQFVLIGSDPHNRDRFEELDERSYKSAKVRDMVDHIVYDPKEDAHDSLSLFKVMCGAMNKRLDRLDPKSVPPTRRPTLAYENGNLIAIHQQSNHWQLQHLPQSSPKSPSPQRPFPTGVHQMARSLSLSENHPHDSRTQPPEHFHSNGYLHPQNSQEFPRRPRSNSTRSCSTLPPNGGYQEYSPLLSPLDAIPNGQPRSQLADGLHSSQRTNGITAYITPEDRAVTPSSRRHSDENDPFTPLTRTSDFPAAVSTMYPPHLADFRAQYRHGEQESLGYDWESLWKVAVVVLLLTIALLFLWQITQR